MRWVETETVKPYGGWEREGGLMWRRCKEGRGAQERGIEGTEGTQRYEYALFVLQALCGCNEALD